MHLAFKFNDAHKLFLEEMLFFCLDAIGCAALNQLIENITRILYKTLQFESSMPRWEFCRFLRFDFVVCFPLAFACYRRCSMWLCVYWQIHQYQRLQIERRPMARTIDDQGVEIEPTFTHSHEHNCRVTDHFCSTFAMYM